MNKKQLLTKIILIILFAFIFTTKPSYAIDESKYHDTIESAAEELREQLTKREDTILINIKHTVEPNDISNCIQTTYTDILYKAYEHTGVGDEGDYLFYHVFSYSGNVSGDLDGNTFYATYEYDMKYYTTKQQEELVTEKLKSLYSELGLSSMDTYSKIESIYEYITDNTVYDIEGAMNPTDRHILSAHAALIDKKAVCQGYSTLLYRMLLDNGIDARMITGQGNKGAHAWNIVKLGDMYYDLDSTWDAVGNRDIGSPYKYFLKSDADFGDHTREDYVFLLYTGEEFKKKYPIASESYKTEAQINPFTDVKNGKYYTDSILYLNERGVMTGLNKTTFGFNKLLSREDMVTLLWKNEGKPDMKVSTNVFKDIAPGKYYSDAVSWAKEGNIAGGYTSGARAGYFGKGDTISRQDFVKIIYGYASYKGYDTEVKSATSYTEKTDAGKVSRYARESMNWAYEKGLVGQGSPLNPKGNITRQDAAVIIARFLKNIGGEHT